MSPNATAESVSVRPAHTIGRWLAEIFPDGEPVEGEAPLELMAEATDPPRLAEAKVIEGRELRAIAVTSPPSMTPESMRTPGSRGSR